MQVRTILTRPRTAHRWIVIWYGWVWVGKVFFLLVMHSAGKRRGVGVEAQAGRGVVCQLAFIPSARMKGKARHSRSLFLYD